MTIQGDESKTAQVPSSIPTLHRHRTRAPAHPTLRIRVEGLRGGHQIGGRVSINAVRIPKILSAAESGIRITTTLGIGITTKMTRVPISKEEHKALARTKTATLRATVSEGSLVGAHSYIRGGRNCAHHHDYALAGGDLMTILKRLRENSSLSPEQLAAAAGINLAWYYDLETHDDELTSNVSLDSIARIARALGVKPSALYGAQSSGIVSLELLASLLREHVDHSGKSLDDFETEIGWSVAAALANPEEFREFNADGLRATCEAVNVVWYDVLDGL